MSKEWLPQPSKDAFPLDTPLHQATVKRGHLAVSDLRRRGWTHALVSRFLAEPDAGGVNPYHPSSHQMKLYVVERVLEMEASDAFAAAMAAAEARRKKSLLVVESRRAKSFECARTIAISLPQRTLIEVLLAAMSHYNDMASEYRHGERLATTQSPPEFIARIAVNYLRHSLGYLEEEMTELYGQPGRAMAFLVFHRRVLTAITFEYPELEDECLRQLADLSARRDECWQEDLFEFRNGRVLDRTIDA